MHDVVEQVEDDQAGEVTFGSICSQIEVVTFSELTYQSDEPTNHCDIRPSPKVGSTLSPSAADAVAGLWE